MEIPTITIEDDTHIYYDSGKIFSKRYKRFIGAYDGKGYIIITINSKTKRVHRLIYEKFVGKIPDGFDVDHLNHIKDDNRVINLDVKTHESNCQRRLLNKRNTSGYIGVCFNKRDNCWRVKIYNNGKIIFYKGGLATAEEGNVARNKFLDDNPELCEFYTRN